MENLYEVLHCEPTSTQDEIKKAYQLLALKYHPDKSKTNSVCKSSEEFIKLNRAWKILGDVKIREQFNVRWAERCLVQSYPIQDTVDFDQFEPLNVGSTNAEDEYYTEINKTNSYMNTGTNKGDLNLEMCIGTTTKEIPAETIKDDTTSQLCAEIKTTNLSNSDRGGGVEVDYGYECRCGGYYCLTNMDVQMKLDFVCCDSCSLMVKVVYSEDENS